MDDSSPNNSCPTDLSTPGACLWLPTVGPGTSTAFVKNAGKCLCQNMYPPNPCSAVNCDAGSGSDFYHCTGAGGGNLSLGSRCAYSTYGECLDAAKLFTPDGPFYCTDASSCQPACNQGEWPEPEFNPTGASKQCKTFSFPRMPPCTFVKKK